jgi:hypothetical protein
MGVVPVHVIMLSDEQDPAWWDLIDNEGWYTTSFVELDTLKHGKW